MSAREFISSGSPWEALAGYSRAVVDGRWVFVSGTVGYDARTDTWPPSAEEQATVALDIIERALREAGAGVLDVVRARIYVPDRADVPAVSAVIAQRLGPARATNTTVCTPLAVEHARVEIEVTALRRRGRRAAPRPRRARRRGR
jgi:enamine deaminase RidA (YjgF/YER057c/UK114 family)